MENTENKVKKSLMTRIQDFLDTPKGRILLNYLYSWGAAIVILGALFKLTHIKGANLMLFIGMGTEVLVFFISGFERPYIPGQESDDNADEGNRGHGSIIINGNLEGGVLNLGSQTAQQPAPAAQPLQQVPARDSNAAACSTVPDTAGLEVSAQNCAERISQLAESMEKMLTHSQRMEQSSEELEQLTRNLISINTFYEMHLKAAGQQMQNLESASQETGRMVGQIEELNRVYARMIEAMKVNSQLGNS